MAVVEVGIWILDRTGLVEVRNGLSDVLLGDY